MTPCAKLQPALWLLAAQQGEPPARETLATLTGPHPLPFRLVDGRVRQVADCSGVDLNALASEVLASGLCDATRPGQSLYDLKAWMVYGCNLIQAMPDRPRLIEAIQQLELLVAVDVLDDHDGVVDQQADRQRQRQHRHHVEGEAEQVEEPDGGDHRGRQGQRADEGRAPVAQEAEHDHDREQRAEAEVDLDLVERLLDVGRAVLGDGERCLLYTSPSPRD